MANILRVKTKWTGFSGAPGYTNLHFRDFSSGGDGSGAPSLTEAQAAYQKTYAFFSGISSVLSDNMRCEVQSEVDYLEDTTGSLVDSFTVAPNPIVNGSVTATYAGPVGAVVSLRTGAIRNGRRIRGRIFIVPIAATTFDTDGTLRSDAVTDINTAVAVLTDNTSAPDLGIFARPSLPGAADGQWAVVTSGSCSDKVAVLRSRRD